MNKLLFVLVALALLSSFAASPSVSAEASDPVSLVQQWVAGLDSYNADAMTKLVGDDFEMKIIYGKPDDPVISGKQGVSDLVEGCQKDKFLLTVTDLTADGNHVKGKYSGIGDDIRSKNVGPEIGTIDGIIENGLIKSLTFTVDPDFVKRYDAAAAVLQTAQATTTPTTAATPAPNSSFDGYYYTYFGKEDLRNLGFEEAALCDMGGFYRLTVQKGQWTLAQIPLEGCSPATVSHEGTLTVQGDQVAFHENNRDCGADSTYRWQVESVWLRFIKVTDECYPRVVVLSSHVWVKHLIPPPAFKSTAAPTRVPATAVVFPSLGGADLFGDEELAGFYKTPASFSIPFTFETNQRFRGMTESFPHGEIFGIAPQGRANLPPKMLLFWAFDSTVSTDRLITELRSTPNLILNPNQAANVQGIQGTLFDGTTEQAITIPALGNLIGHVGDDWQPDSSLVHIQFIVLSVGGRTLLIYIEAPKDEFAAFVPDALEVLTTVKFEK